MLNNFEDVSEATNLDKEEIMSRLKDLAQQKEELSAALARYYFLKYSGKNLIITLNNGKNQCVVCRGNIFFVYSVDSTCTKPSQYTYLDVIENFEKSVEEIEKVTAFKIVNNREATEFIKDIYAKRAHDEKLLLKQILDYKE